jgi:iron complex outermembrane receptor protein
MRIAIVAAAVSMALVGLSAADEVAAAIRKPTNIPAQHLGSALQTLAKERGLQVVYLSDQVDALRTQGATGEFTPDEALERLLTGTGLSFRYLDEATITVFRAASGADSGGTSRSAIQAPVAPTAAPVSKKSFWDRFRISQASYAAPSMRLASAAQEATGGAAQQERRQEGVEEVIVTATKRAARLSNVAAPISAVTGQQLQDMGAQSLSDYITKLPGVQFNDYQPGVSEVIIRGLSATTYHEQGQTVVGYYINEIPLSEAGWPVVIPDVDTFDLDRVEVLRGPQGTLFGASSLGGAVNYIAREANPAQFESAVEAMVGETRNAGEMNYAAKGMVNIPLATDKFAIRAVALQRYEAGFIDNRVTGNDGAGDFTTQGARLSAVWTPSEQTKVSWLTMYQEGALEDQTYLILGTMERDAPGLEPHDTELMINSLRLDHEFGFGTLTLLGSLADKDGRPVWDSTNSCYLQGCVPTSFRSHVEAEATHFEARLASSSDADSRWTWLVGAAYYDSRKDVFDVIYQAGAADFIDANPGSFAGIPGDVLAPNDWIDRYVVDQSNEDKGLFGEVSFELTPRVTATLGGRFFDTKSDTTVSRPPGIFSFTPTSFNQLQDETGFTPKATLAFRPREGFLTYATYSQGFRVGGANPNPPTITGVPTSYDSDSSKNYEVGLRTSMAGNRVVIDASVFRIDWEDIQVRLFTPAPFFYSYVTNAGQAQIDGVEFSSAWQVTPMFGLQASVTYQDAAVSEFLPDTFAINGLGGHPAGTVLPGSSKWSTAATATLNLDNLPWSPRLELSHRYISDAPVAFSSPTTRGEFGILDARAAFDVRDNVSVSIFANNLLDKYGVRNAPFADFPPHPYGSVTRPRSIGVRLNWDLK